MASLAACAASLAACDGAPHWRMYLAWAFALDALCEELATLVGRGVSSRTEAQMTINDIGPHPQSFNIEHATKENTDYRSICSRRYLQVTLMSIPRGTQT
jgi:hypothetical protein